MLSYAADKQTDKQTEPNMLPTPTDSIDVDNNSNHIISACGMEGGAVSQLGSLGFYGIPMITCHQISDVSVPS